MNRCLTAAAVLMLPVAGGCDGLGLSGILQSLTVELVNETDYPVDPGLYADDDDRTFFEFNIRTDENFVDVGIVPAHSTVRVPLSCDEAGTMMTYAARQIRSGSDRFSDNDPIVYEDGDFDCHDVISFVFRDSAFDFWTEVEVNGRVIIY
jgi:hypothetical protein